jgi:hypothetical protein
MSSRETVIAFVSRLPEDMPLAEIAREIELLAGLKTAREQARRGEGIPSEDARKLELVDVPIPIRPPGYFAQCYTKAEIQEDNRLAKASVVRAPTDLE